ncbi:hypothetical protein QAD02_003558, partial [Eretmocerus hayati]
IELFREPVSLKCGHRFCRNCILRVAGNENSSCPLCNIKIQKRSIPRDSCALVQQCIDHYRALCQAIFSDSGIDATRSLNKPLSTNEGIRCETSTRRTENTLRKIEESTAIYTIRTPSSKILSKKKLTSGKKRSATKRESAGVTNRIDKYLSNAFDCDSKEKVESWLQNLTPDLYPDNDILTNREVSEEIHPSGNQSIGPIHEDLKTSTLGLTSSEPYEVIQDSDEELAVGTEVSSYIETRTILGNVETMAKKKKSPDILEKIPLKTPSIVPAASYPDAQDWRRVKKVAKEMQVKTFKSLDLSVEKRCASPNADDTGDSRNLVGNTTQSIVLKESDPNQRDDDKLDISRSKEKSANILSTSMCADDNSNKREVPMNGSEKSHDERFSHPEDNEIIQELHSDGMGIDTRVISCTYVEKDSMKTRDCSLTNQTSMPEKGTSCPLIIRTKLESLGYRKPSDFDNDESIVELSQAKSKLSLRLSLKNVSKSSPVADKIEQLEDGTLQCNSPGESRTRPSLRRSIFEGSGSKLNCCTGSISSCPGGSEGTTLRKNPHIVFKKIGKVCKKRKNVPFIYLRKSNSEETNNSEGSSDTGSIKEPISKLSVKSNIPVEVNHETLKLYIFPGQHSSSKNLEIFPTDTDSQLKFLAPDSSISCRTRVGSSDPQCSKERRTPTPMDTEKPPQGRRKYHHSLYSSQNIIHKAHSHAKGIENREGNDVRFQSTPDDAALSAGTQIKTDCSETQSELKERTAPNMPEILSPDSSEHITKCHDYARRLSNDGNLTDNPNPSGKTRGKSENDIISIISKDNSADEFDDEFDIGKNIKKHTPSLPISSSRRVSSSKRGRISSGSSEGDEHDRTMDELLGRWGTDSEPASKQPKTSNRDDVQTIKGKTHMNQNTDSKGTHPGISRVAPFLTKTALEKGLALVRVHTEMRSPRENEVIAENLIPMSNILSSTDLLENEAEVTPERLKKKVASTSDRSPSILWSPSEIIDRGDGQPDSDLMIIDNEQFHNRESHSSKSPDVSNKENREVNQFRMSTYLGRSTDSNPGSAIGNSGNVTLSKTYPANNHESYHVSDSLMNITQEQLARREVEKDLFGITLSEIRSNENPKNTELQKCRTRLNQEEESQKKNRIEDAFDSENIGGTPVVERRSKLDFPAPIDDIESEKFEVIVDPGTSPRDHHNSSVITPVRNNLHPINHSTPMVNTSRESRKFKRIVLVCSCLRSDDFGRIQLFVERFNAELQSSFSMDTTHVIFRVDPKTKAGQKTFKYVQGIGYKKYVVSVQWIEDCLEQNMIIDEENEKYDVLDPDTLISGAREARTQPPSLFENFVCLCLEPFDSCGVDEFKDLLHYNGAVVATSWEQLNSFTDRYRVIILGSDSIDQKVVDEYKGRKVSLIHFEWVIDSLSQYHITSLVPYFYETTPEEALEYGIPPEFLVEDEIAEETDIDME